jgi:hypothetical protein
MRYARQVIDGETVMVRLPDEPPVPADPGNGVEASNPPGSYEQLLRMFTPPDGGSSGQD